MVRRLTPSAFLLLLALASPSCKEDTTTPEVFGAITGAVYAVDGKTPLAGASIATNPPTSSLLTDKTGSFLIADIPTGSYAVSVSLTGYKKSTVSIAVTEGATTRATIILERA